MRFFHGIQPQKSPRKTQSSKRLSYGAQLTIKKDPLHQGEADFAAHMVSLQDGSEENITASQNQAQNIVSTLQERIDDLEAWRELGMKTKGGKNIRDEIKRLANVLYRLMFPDEEEDLTEFKTEGKEKAVITFTNGKTEEF